MYITDGKRLPSDGQMERTSISSQVERDNHQSLHSSKLNKLCYKQYKQTVSGNEYTVMSPSCTAHLTVGGSS